VIILLFSYPANTLSVAFSKSSLVTNSLLCLAATIALSLHKFDISAPENPGVRVASLLDYSSIYFEGSNFKGFK